MLRLQFSNQFKELSSHNLEFQCKEHLPMFKDQLCQFKDQFCQFKLLSKDRLFLFKDQSKGLFKDLFKEWLQSNNLSMLLSQSMKNQFKSIMKRKNQSMLLQSNHK
jgi:hypothetical protein